MTIGINGNEANVAHRVGVGQYAFELLSHFPKENIVVYLQNQPLPDMPRLNYEVFGPKKLWTLTGLQRKLLAHPPNVLFTPTHYAPLYLPMPSVISIMDTSFETLPQYFKKRDLYQLRYWTWLSAHQAKKIITISQFSKKEICKIYNFPPEKVVVTHPGYNAERFNPKVKSQKSKVKSASQKYKIGGPYFLFLGTLQPRKNLERLLEAYAQLATDCQLVVVGMINEGRGGWMYQEIFNKVKNLGLENRVIFTGYVPDADVPYLLSGSLAYVLPSLYEGFGIPPIEAMATGVPVVVSRVSSLPEICGEAATYIEDPYNIVSIRQALQEVLLQTATQRAKRIDLGLGWVKRYNWENTAKKTLEVLYEAAQR